MKKILTVALSVLLALSLTASALALTIAVPNDTTNEGRALLLLQANGFLTLKDGAGITATKEDIADNPLGIELYEVEAANVPNLLADPAVDYAIINNNYALDFGLNPATDSLLKEDADSPYVNVVSVAEANADADLTKALVAAVTSQQVVDFIAENWADGSVVSTVTEPTDGYDASVDYDAVAAALEGKPVRIGATPVPHVPILNVAKEILAAKGIELEIVEYSDYVQPNLAVESGDLYANFFAHTPYQDNFNAENGTHLVNVAGVHVEPMGLYGAQQKDLGALKGE